MTNDSLKQTSHTGIAVALLYGSPATTARSAESFSCGQVTRIRAACRSGISRSIFGRTKEKVKAEQRQLLSQILHCFGKARSIMRQKRRKAQPENTVHKDMIREQLARSSSPRLAELLREILQKDRLRREGHE